MSLLSRRAGRARGTNKWLPGDFLTLVRLFLIVLILSACKGDAGPTGPQGPVGPQGPIGPQGPAGPAGPGVSYQVFSGAVTSTLVQTDVVQTGGVTPGIICYLAHSSVPNTWITLDTVVDDGTACGIVISGTGFRGRALLPASLVNSGWSVRIILFWTTS